MRNVFFTAIIFIASLSIHANEECMNHLLNNYESGYFTAQQAEDICALDECAYRIVTTLYTTLNEYSIEEAQAVCELSDCAYELYNDRKLTLGALTIEQAKNQCL